MPTPSAHAHLSLPRPLPTTAQHPAQRRPGLARPRTLTAPPSAWQAATLHPLGSAGRSQDGHRFESEQSKFPCTALRAPTAPAAARSQLLWDVLASTGLPALHAAPPTSNITPVSSLLGLPSSPRPRLCLLGPGPGEALHRPPCRALSLSGLTFHSNDVAPPGSLPKIPLTESHSSTVLFSSVSSAPQLPAHLVSFKNSQCPVSPTT